jgi:hypothetical protein
MAEFSWSRSRTTAAPTTTESLWSRLPQRYLNWEDWLTFGLALLAVLAVSYGLQSSNWSTQMPAIVLVSVLALTASLIMAKSRMSIFAAWPLAILLGALVTLWQTLDAVGPGTLETRVHAIYDRFYTWFQIAFGSGVTNDSLPFNTLVVAITWLGTFAFGWSVFRWHHAWLGLLPGGAALFLGLIFVSDALATAIALYMLFGFLLIMRTNLTKRMAEWRATKVVYPPMLSLSFMHLTTWAMVVLLAVAWIAPVGPYATPGAVDAVVSRFEGMGVDIIRLAGPLHVSKVIPVHNYRGVLPLQGSVDLGERELLLVELQDPTIQGPIALRGTVYDEYGSGGWIAGDRTEFQPPAAVGEELNSALSGGIEDEQIEGRLVPLNVTLKAKSVVGTVLFTPGQAVSSDPPVKLEVPSGSLESVEPTALMLSDGSRFTDDEVIERFVPDGFIGTHVERDDTGAVVAIRGFFSSDQLLPDVTALSPDERIRKGRSYTVTGFVPTLTPGDLRAAGDDYPGWVEKNYLALPDSLPDRVAGLARDIAGGEANPYDKALALQTHLRGNYTVTYSPGEPPPGEDTIDYFLFESRTGFFDYHASAMTVMLRALDVPSRFAVGFVVDEADASEVGSYTVRDKNAYAWTEVYFPGYGWIPFNPSPDRPADLTPSERVEGDINGDGVIDLSDFPGLPVGADPIVGLGEEEGFSSGIESLPSGTAGGGSNASSYAMWLLLGTGVVAVMIAVSAAMGWRRSTVGLPYAQAVWEKTVRLATLAGHGPQPGQTPGEFARDLQRSFRGHRVIEDISGAYTRSRFGRRELSERDRGRIERQWPHLRTALIGRMFSRLLRRRGSSLG